MTITYQKSTKESLIDLLSKDYDIEDATLEGKTKKELWDQLKLLSGGNMDDLVEQVIDVEEAVKDVKTEPSPAITDYAWNDYVMAKFGKDELVQGNPTVDGMLRVCELLIGKIFEINSDIIQVPTVENERRATVKVKITISECNGKDFEGYSNYDGAADVYYGNTDGAYAKHPVALAETRALGRALKRALRLRKVVSAEEIAANAETTESDVGSKDPINDNQKNFINLCCSKERANINVEKFVKTLYNNARSINDVTYEQAKELLKKIDEYNRKQDTIPEEIKGFDGGWLTTFGG